MSPYDEVISVLMEGRPQSSSEAITKVVERLGVAVSEEVLKLTEKEPFSDTIKLWKAIRYRPVFDDLMKKMIGEVGRMHVIYVYSRFLSSKLIGPLIVKAALEQRKTELRR